MCYGPVLLILHVVFSGVIQYVILIPLVIQFSMPFPFRSADRFQNMQQLALHACGPESLACETRPLLLLIVLYTQLLGLQVGEKKIRFLIHDNECVSKSELCISVSRWGRVAHPSTKPQILQSQRILYTL